MKNSSSLIIGIILVLVGLLLLGPSANLFSLQRTWPAIIMLIGLGFLLGYAGSRHKAVGLLMPAAVLIISSLPLFQCAWTGDWTAMSTLWPIFPLSVAIGFFLMYFAGPKEKGLLIPALILTAISVIAFLTFNYLSFIFPILFIGSGLVLIFLSVSKSRAKFDTKETPKQEAVEEASKE